MRRLSLLALGLALWAPIARAQTGPGTIHYTQGSALYRISGAPNSTPVLVPNTPGTMYRTTDLRYGVTGLERHRYFHSVDLGTFTYGTQTLKYGDYYAWNEATGIS